MPSKLERDLAARVVAWHNRHPLARRITPAQVMGMGVVVLPFIGPEDGSAARGGPTSNFFDAALAHDPHPPHADHDPHAAAAVVDEPGDDPHAAAPVDPSPEPAPDDDLSLPERAAARLQAEAAAADDTAEAPPGDAMDDLAAALASATPDSPDGAAAEAPAEPVAGASDTVLEARPADPGPPPDDITAEPAGGPRPATARRKVPAWLFKLLPGRRTAQPQPAVRARPGGRRGKSPALQAAFSEDFIAPLTPAQVARFGQRHGEDTRPGPVDWPQRFVVVDTPLSPHLVPRFVRTASIEVDGQRTRVLVGAGERGAVIGPRIMSPQRTRMAGGLALCALLAAGAPWWLGALHHPTDAMVMAQAASAPLVDASASAASAEPAASAASSAAQVAVDALAAASAAASSAGVAMAAASTPGEGAASAAASVLAAVSSPQPAMGPASTASGAVAATAVAAASAAASAPDAAPVAAAPRHSMPPDIRPRLSDEERAAAKEATAQTRALLASTRPAAAKPAPAPAANGHVYALVTRTTRGRAASEVMQSLMVSAAAGSLQPGQPRPEVMQVGAGWRAVWWPFGSPAEAEQARAVLAQYGINAEIVEF